MRSLGGGLTLSKEELLNALGPLDGCLSQSLTALSGVGKATAKSAERIGIKTLEDLVEHLPVRYEDHTVQSSLSDLALGQDATVVVEVQSCKLRPTRRRRLKVIECKVADKSSTVTAVWFNQDYLARQLVPGTHVVIHGQLGRSPGGLTFKVKSHDLIGEENSSTALNTLGLVPIYSVTEGIAVRRLRQLVRRSLDLSPGIVDPLPAALRLWRGLPSRSDSLRAAHFPDSFAEAALARKRLAFEELLLLQLALGLRRRRLGRAQAPLISLPGKVVDKWLKSLPFKLTDDQLKAVGAIDLELEKQEPMQTLLMGEVGSGKTVIALYAILRSVECGGQALLMAPTETLAEQHFNTVKRLVGDLESVALLTSSTTGSERSRVLDALQRGELKIVVGTHALIEEVVQFADLRLVVVDEQHRFGVEQRAAVSLKSPAGLVPHTLHMTATPIPRTLALTVFGDLDSITLRQLPKGRRPVKTWDVPETKRPGAYQFIRDQLAAGRQCFVICPLVDESDALQAKAATSEGERLATSEFKDFKVAVVHGQMPAAQKQAVMKDFACGEIDVLVATSVIEVGIDIANASVIVVEQAERYGLSQLHQLRGRVGRGGHESYCLLFSDVHTGQARRRIDALVGSNDGFELAEVDLEIRGEGEILGTKQSGIPDLEAAILPRDQELLIDARGVAKKILSSDPELSDSSNALLRQAVEDRFGVAYREPVAA